jgi:hypothetical protein
MPSHQFKLGDKVRLVAPASTNTVEAFLNMVTTIDVTRPPEVWEITRLLPANDGGFQYHIRGTQDGPERLVSERQLQPA